MFEASRVSAVNFQFSRWTQYIYLQLVNEFLQAPPRPAHTFDMGQLLEEMQQIDQQSYRQAPQRGAFYHSCCCTIMCQTNQIPFVSSVISKTESLRLFSILNMAHFRNAAPDVAALALSGDWAAEFLSGPESTSAPGVASLTDAADADWTREFIAEAAGSRCSTQFSSCSGVIQSCR